MARQPWSALVPHIARAGVPAEPALTRLRTFARLVIEWNRGVSNLISKNDESRIVTRHLLESIEPASWLAETAAERWIDFGSGAGFPAIPLAIVGIGRSWTLVESRRPKTLFMRKALEEIKLRDIAVYHGRLESFIEQSSTTDIAAASSEDSRNFDAFTSRATLKLVPTLELAAAVIRKGGTAFLWKGSRRHDELVEASTWNRDWELDRVVELGEGNTAVAKFIKI